MGMLRVRRIKKQMRTIVRVIGYFFLTRPKGSLFRKLMKCLWESTKNLKAIIIEKRGIGI